MGRSEIIHPTLGLMWTVPRAGRYLKISRTEMKRRIKVGGDDYVTWQRRPGAWEYVTVASVEAAYRRHFPEPAPASSAR